MNPIQSFSSQDTMHAIQPGAQDLSGSIMEFMIEQQHLLTKEAREDRQLQRQEQAQELQRQKQAQELQREEQGQQAHGFFQSVGNFLTGNDGGSGNGGTGFARPEKVEQSSLAWSDWKKFLRLH